MPRFPVAAALLLTLAAAARPQPDDPPDGSDAEVLKAVRLSPDDGPGLLAYLKLRTTSEADQGKLAELIRQFGADKFEDRLAAAAAAEKLGPLAISPLRKVAEDKDKAADPEVVYRAGIVLKKLQKVDHAKVSAAAVRGVAKLKPPGAAAALLGFLPLADSEAVADDIREALKDLAVVNGKAEPALLAALTDEAPQRRTVAYLALVEGGPDGKRVRVPDAFDAVKAAVRRDPDPEAKFRGLWALAHTTREKEFIPDLIALVPTLPRGRLWQLEDFLLRLAGEHPPGGRFGKSADDLTKARDAWAGWWAKGGVDLTKADLTPRVRGLTDVLAQDPGFGRGTIYTLGPDLKETWRLPGELQGMPSHMRVLPGGKVLIVEQNFRVTERDRAGAVVSTFNGPQPLTAEVLPNGNWLVIGRTGVSEVRPGRAGMVPTVVKSYTRPKQNPVPGQPFVNTGYDVAAGARLPNGEVVFVTTTPQGPNVFRLNDELKEAGTPLTVARFTNSVLVGIDVTPQGKLLVCHPNQVAEYDLKDGKAAWTYDVPNPTSVQRLANGNTLIASVNAGRAVEVTPEREVVWEYRDPTGLAVGRVYRR